MHIIKYLANVQGCNLLCFTGKNAYSTSLCSQWRARWHYKVCYRSIVTQFSVCHSGAINWRRLCMILQVVEMLMKRGMRAVGIIEWDMLCLLPYRMTNLHKQELVCFIFIIIVFIFLVDLLALIFWLSSCQLFHSEETPWWWFWHGSQHIHWCRKHCFSWGMLLLASHAVGITVCIETQTKEQNFCLDCTRSSNKLWRDVIV